MNLNRMMLVYTSTLPKLGDWAPIPLRLIVGYGFLTPGYDKIEKGPEHFFAILYALGVPAPHLIGWATILIEPLGDWPFWQELL
jgi:putative oxidoreductase